MVLSAAAKAAAEATPGVSGLAGRIDTPPGEAVSGATLLERMRRQLEIDRPSSMAEALRILRASHPDSPLATRVAACQGIRL